MNVSGAAVNDTRNSADDILVRDSVILVPRRDISIQHC